MVVRFTILTLFPSYFDSILTQGLLGKAVETELVKVDRVDLREFGLGKHRHVDDHPFGGGAGMVLRPDVVVPALRSVKEPGSHTIFLTPQGQPMTQDRMVGLAQREHIVLLCGRYEGTDQRAIEMEVDECLSLGDFVLSGGEAPAAAMIEAVSRLLPGVLGNTESVLGESFEGGRLAPPTYTRPEEYEGRKVPEVLISGHHAKIVAWRMEQSEAITRKIRPDLAEKDGFLKTEHEK